MFWFFFHDKHFHEERPHVIVSIYCIFFALMLQNPITVYFSGFSWLFESILLMTTFFIIHTVHPEQSSTIFLRNKIFTDPGLYKRSEEKKKNHIDSTNSKYSKLFFVHIHCLN